MMQPVTRFEIIGCIVSLSGCVITTFDPQALKTHNEDNQIVLGNLLCLISSLFCTAYILKGQEVSERIPGL
jgi:drug/metabolite transporter (DMT)-like permease